MADRRMMSRKVTEDDKFMALSPSAQALYLHLSMSADDDGFTRQISVSMFRAHASTADLETLLSKRFIYQFENGVIVITHWRMANALRKDRYTPTIFRREFEQLGLTQDGEYITPDSDWLPGGCQVVAERLPEVRLGKDRLGKDRLIEGPARARPNIPTVDDVAAYCRERGNNVDAEHFFNYYDSQGWKKANGRPLTNWKAAVITWEKKEGRYGPGDNKGPGKKPAKEYHVKYDND